MPKALVNDIEMHYELRGSGKSLLLIHGLGSSGRDWEDFVQLLPNFQIITIDLRGHGQTSKPKGPYSIKLFTHDIVSLLEFLKIQSTNVLGISLGGSIALQMAIDFPEYVKSITVINAPVEIQVDSFKMKMEALKRSLIVRLVGMKKMGEILATRLFVKPEQEDLRKMLIRRWAQNDKKAYLAAMHALMGWSVKAQLHKIKCPSLIIGSDDDYTPSSIKREYTALIPDANFIEIKDARHAVSAEKPEELSEIVRNFIANMNA
ncbi:MAG: alpha/beta hydrolase [Candidatus Lokiarchaeota archaeon]|nr:alpha/beta hydrolase [Candidatus Lokiarchaeota archaeon]